MSSAATHAHYAHTCTYTLDSSVAISVKSYLPFAIEVLAVVDVVWRADGMLFLRKRIWTVVGLKIAIELEKLYNGLLHAKLK